METTLVARDLKAVERRLQEDAAEFEALIDSGSFDDEAARLAVTFMRKRAAEVEVIRRSL